MAYMTKISGTHCIYYPGDPECEQYDSSFFRNHRGLIRFLCDRCCQMELEIHEQEGKAHADWDFKIAPLTEEILDEFVCQEVMES
jgi:hypothetical protein